MKRSGITGGYDIPLDRILAGANPTQVSGPDDITVRPAGREVRTERPGGHGMPCPPGLRSGRPVV